MVCNAHTLVRENEKTMINDSSDHVLIGKSTGRYSFTEGGNKNPALGRVRENL